jgi:hypothetical protein
LGALAGHSLIDILTRAQVHRSRILHGIALQGLVAGRAHTIPFSPRSAALPLGPISVEELPVTDVAITSTASASEAALVQLGFAPSAAAHAVRSASLLSDDVSPNGDVPAIYVTCRMVYTRVLVRTELEDLSPSPQLVADIENALALPEQADQTDALRTVLRRWGSVIATRVELGYALVCTSMHESCSRVPQVSVVFWSHFGTHNGDSSASYLTRPTLGPCLPLKDMCRMRFVFTQIPRLPSPRMATMRSTKNWLDSCHSKP